MVAIVTGANRDPGIGFEIVRGLAQRQSHGTVVLCARDRGMGEEAAAKLQGENKDTIE